MKKRKKRWQRIAVLSLFLMGVVLLNTGCVSRPKKTRKLRDLEYVIVDKDLIPSELQLLIEENKSMPFKLTYSEQGKLYIVEGYGTQPTTGYSVEVNSLYETENAIYIDTNLLGPGKEEEIKEISTFPYVVVQLEALKKKVMFD